MMTKPLYTAERIARGFKDLLVARLLIRHTAPDGRATGWKKHYFAATNYPDAAVMAYGYADVLAASNQADETTGVVRRMPPGAVPYKRAIEILERNRKGILAVPEYADAAEAEKPTGPLFSQTPAPQAMTRPDWSDLEV